MGRRWVCFCGFPGLKSETWGTQPVWQGERMEVMLPDTRQFDAALGIVGKLRAAGYEAYLAGGCVRDLLLGREPKDYDVATSATPEVVLELFPRTFAVGAHFGVVLVATCGTCGAATCGGADTSQEGQSEESKGEKPTEVATFRSDGAYSDGRHPDAVRYTTSAEEDVRRRDFTINGLLLDPAGQDLCSPRFQDRELGHPAELQDAGPPTPLRSAQDDRSIATRKELRSAVIDYVGGMADLDAGVVRAIGKAEERFEEDRLRMLRAVRFAARFGFDIEAGTARAIRGLAGRIQAVSRERVRDELTEMLPEVALMKGVEQPPQFHPEGDVWTHTLLLLGQLEAGCALTLAWGALLHDVGKPPTFRLGPDRIRFDGHVDVGVAMGAEICRRFRFSNEETRQIVALIENHMRFMDAGRMKASTLKRFFRLPGFDEHLALHRMHCLAGSGNLEHWEFVRERWLAMPEETVRPRPLITGRELIAAGYKPGAGFKEMLRAVEDAQLEGTIATADEALRLVRERFPVPSF